MAIITTYLLMLIAFMLGITWSHAGNKKSGSSFKGQFKNFVNLFFE